MPLSIANTRTDRLAVEMTGVTPDALAPLSLDAVRRARVFHGNQSAELGELFTIAGDASDMQWRLAGDFSAVHGLGAGMAAGQIEVDGSVGRRAGAAMRGGRLVVRGDAGDWVGAEMAGGEIAVHGAAGAWVGAALPGSVRGMAGGRIIVGHAGDELGRRMRRGTIAVVGDVGERTGADLLAGTILVFGRCGSHPGLAMRRGTIGLFGPEPPPLLPTFRLACRAPLPMLGLLRQELRGTGKSSGLLDRLLAPVDLYHGDLLQSGRGEVLVHAPR